MKKGLKVIFLIVLFFILPIISAELVLQNDKTFVEGDLWDIGDGYQIYIRTILGDMGKADIALGRGSSNLEEKWFNDGDKFNYLDVISSTIIVNYNPATSQGSVTFTNLSLQGSLDKSEEPSTSGSMNCSENWECSLWTNCINNTQKRKCIDKNNCGTNLSKPGTIQSCSNSIPRVPSSDCVESWVCTSWADCDNNQQSRLCIDQNACDTSDDKPIVARLCDSSQSSDDESSSSSSSHSSRSSTNITTIIYEYHYNNPVLDYLGFNSSDDSGFFPISFLSPFLLAILSSVFIGLIILLFLYIYVSSAFSSIAKKTMPNHPSEFAWFPIIGPLLIARRAARMHWWPVLLLLLLFVPYVNFIVCIVLFVFFTIWMWRTFRALDKPGWWSLFNIVPLAGNFLFLIFLGIAAWSSSSLATSESMPSIKKSQKKISKKVK